MNGHALGITVFVEWVRRHHAGGMRDRGMPEIIVAKIKHLIRLNKTLAGNHNVLVVDKCIGMFFSQIKRPARMHLYRPIVAA